MLRMILIKTLFTIFVVPCLVIMTLWTAMKLAWSYADFKVGVRKVTVNQLCDCEDCKKMNEEME